MVPSSDQVAVEKSCILGILMTRESASLDLLFSIHAFTYFFLLHFQMKKKPLDVFPPRLRL
jgi:hypothetical protein